MHVGLGRIIRRFDRLLIIVAAVKAIKTSKFANTQFECLVDYASFLVRSQTIHARP